MKHSILILTEFSKKGDNMKKCMTILLTVVMIFAFCACKEKPKEKKSFARYNSDTIGETYTEAMEKESDFVEENITDELKKAEWRTHSGDYKLIAFTFDDAPPSSMSDEAVKIPLIFIDTLNKYEGAGTFMVQGNCIDRNGTGILKYALNHGFELGNHTYSHPHLPELSDEEIREEMEKVNTQLNDLLGVRPKFIRAGYNDIDDRVLSIAKEENLALITQTAFIGDYDYNSYNWGYVKSAVLKSARDGGIVLLHSWSETSYECFESICETLYNEGYRFVTLSELYEMKGITPPLGVEIKYAE